MGKGAILPILRHAFFHYSRHPSRGRYSHSSFRRRLVYFKLASLHTTYANKWRLSDSTARRATRHLAKFLAGKGYSAAVLQNGARTVEGMFKMLREEFQYQPTLKVG